MITVVIPTNRHILSNLDIFTDLAHQTHPISLCIIVYDRMCDRYEYDQICKFLHDCLGSTPFICVSHLSHPSFIPGKGVSFVRNYGIALAQTPYICCVDDDNRLTPNFIQQVCSVCKPGICGYPCEKKPDGSVRTFGYHSFSPRLGRPVSIYVNLLSTVSMSSMSIMAGFCSSNCFWGDRSIFLSYPFPEDIPFVYEDFFCFSRISKHAKLLCFPNIFVTHYMKQKTRAQDTYVHTPQHAYRKGKHRILFARSVFGWFQWLIYLFFGLPGQTLYLCFLILFGSGVSYRWGCIKNFFLGTWEGIKQIHRLKKNK